MSTPPPGFERRHVVTVEDHLYHTAEMLEVADRSAPQLLECLTCCAIDDPGADTTAAVISWLEQYPAIQVAACVERQAVPATIAHRLLPIDPSRLSELASFARLVASLLRPGGILLQDVHLSTLRFIAPDRWWESIYIAAMVRGTFPRRQPAVRFLSNKRGYTATFGRDLMDAGFDPRDVLEKAELESVVVPSLVREVRSRFPLQIVRTDAARPLPMAADEESRAELERELDVVLWSVGGRLELSGRALQSSVAFRPGSQEARTWRQLIEDRIEHGSGVPISQVGQRLAEAGAEKAEMSNLAARHVHTLRARFAAGPSIQTANHAYRLDASLAVGLVEGTDPGHLR